jgi:hypothetical protein
VNPEISLDVLGKRKIPCPNLIQTPVLQVRGQLRYSFSRPSQHITECYTTLDHDTEYFGTFIRSIVSILTELRTWHIPQQTIEQN